MATVKWILIGSEVNTSTSILNSLTADTESSSGIVIDNSTDLALYARLRIELGSFSPVANQVLTAFNYCATGSGTNVEDFNKSGDPYFRAIKSGSSVTRRIYMPMIRLYPWFNYITFYNSASGATLASSGNSVYYQLYGEQV